MFKNSIDGEAYTEKCSYGLSIISPFHCILVIAWIVILFNVVKCSKARGDLLVQVYIVIANDRLTN